MNKFFAAAVVAAGFVGVSAPALADHQWGSSNRDWYPVSSCTLRLDSAYQANPGQPIHLKITNQTRGRVQYTLDITLQRRGSTVFTGSINVDNANQNEQTDAGTSNAFSGDLSNTRLVVRVRTCSPRT